jgi:hypothetical protein
MNINHHNYEIILIDYLDGNLPEAERIEVELFLQQNPEIAEQISDFADVVLPNEIISYDKKHELQIVSKSNADFEQWENTQPKLPKTLVSYPHKRKLLKPTIRRMPQWTWYAAAAACLAIAVLSVNPFRHSERSEESVSERLAQIENGEWKMENEIESVIVQNVTPITTTHKEEKLKAENKIMPNDNDEAEPNSQFSILNSPFSIAVLTPKDISTIDDINQKSKCHPERSEGTKNQKSENSEQIFREVYTEAERSAQDDNLIAEDDNFQLPLRERLQLAVNEIVLDPLRTVVHNVTKRFYERKTDIELFLEQRDIPRYFAQK